AALRKALASKSTAREKAWEFRRGFDEIYERLDRKKRAPPEPKPKTTGKAEFKPRMEAPLPVGFPQPGPVGRVVIKKYPAYRAARAKGGSNGAFWKLFGHIKKNDIAMTAPVEMTMDERGEAMVQADMAFLYERPSQGSTGADGAVDVIDRMGIEVLSIGIRGPMTERKVKDARAAIQQRLRDVGWKAGGKWRLLGYNSPMVPASQRFWELQLPILPGSDS
ncbi:MAG: heme-binding protein, partial [Planctomycetota bacterium]|nr:heme-binding protein [Planctomycetota bacterium]